MNNGSKTKLLSYISPVGFATMPTTVLDFFTKLFFVSVLRPPVPKTFVFDRPQSTGSAPMSAVTARRSTLILTYENSSANFATRLSAMLQMHIATYI